MIIGPNYKKFNSKNPIVARVVKKFLNNIHAIISITSTKRIIDLGCGEGYVGNFLYSKQSQLNYLGVDRDDLSLKIGSDLFPHLKKIKADFIQESIESTNEDLVLSTETLEHMEHPEIFLEKLKVMDCHTIVLSVPWEPYFRVGNFLRGKYLLTLGNHKGHIQFFNPESLKELTEKYFENVRIVTSFPWIICVIKK